MKAVATGQALRRDRAGVRRHGRRRRHEATRRRDGYQHAAANESDPSPGDIADFEHALRDGSMSVLVFNTQTDGAHALAAACCGPRPPRAGASSVTETVPPGAKGFVSWQVGQLQALAKALGG